MNKKKLVFILVNRINYKIYGYLCLLILFLGICSFIESNDTSTIIDSIILCIGIFFGIFCFAYLSFDLPYLTQEPLIIIENEYCKMMDKLNELEFINGNKEEIINIKNIQEKYKKAIELLKNNIT